MQLEALKLPDFPKISRRILYSAPIGARPSSWRARARSHSLRACASVSAHTDAPRLDFNSAHFRNRWVSGKPKTHYYGGIRKYQWGTIPLAMHGVVVKKTERRWRFPLERMRRSRYSA